MKNKKVNFIIILFLGVFGVHKFMEGNIKQGLIYLFTGGVFGIGWIVDVIKALFELIRENSSSNNLINNSVKDEQVINKENYISEKDNN